MTRRSSRFPVLGHVYMWVVVQARALFRECYHDGDVDGVKVGPHTFCIASSSVENRSVCQALVQYLRTSAFLPLPFPPAPAAPSAFSCFCVPYAPVLQVVLTAMDVRDSYRVHEVASSLNLPVPIIALCLGEKGKLSRVLNSRYTPLYHLRIEASA